jgi:DNA-binding LacI/PurR family transcriptional regulator
MKNKRPTLRDVAEEAGVSYQTVSRVINNNENVSGKTRSRVLKAIEKLDFRVNRAAQIMQTERSHTIEVVLFYAGFNLFLYEMARSAQRAGYHFVISAITEDEFESTLEGAASRFIDGLVIVPMMPMAESFSELEKLCNGIPFVQVGARMGSDVPAVMYDQAQGSRAAVEHLISLGHRKIAEISGPLANHDGADRHETYLKVLRENALGKGLSIEGDFSIDSGYHSMKQLLESGGDFSAVFMGNDSMAFGAHSALREAGLRVPEDISIVSFDDVPEAAHFVPKLTTVRQDFQALGRLTIEYLLSMIENPETEIYQRVLQPQLMIRESTCPFEV